MPAKPEDTLGLQARRRNPSRPGRGSERFIQGAGEAYHSTGITIPDRSNSAQTGQHSDETKGEETKVWSASGKMAAPSISLRRGSSATSIEPSEESRDSVTLSTGTGTSSGLHLVRSRSSFGSDVSCMKPVYTLDASTVQMGRAISKDRLVSSAYGVVARKVDERRRASLEETRPARDFEPKGYFFSTPGKSRDYRSTRLRVKATLGPGVRTGASKNTALMTDKIENFLLRAPQIYDSTFANQGSVRRNAYRERARSLPATGVSFHGKGSKPGGRSESMLPLPVRTSMPLVHVQSHLQNYHRSCVVSATMLGVKTSGGVASDNSLGVKTSSDLLSRSNRELNALSKEDVPGDRKVKITIGMDGVHTSKSDVNRVREINHFNARLVPVSELREGDEGRRRLREEFRRKKRLMKTGETSKLACLHVVSAARKPFADDCRAAFRSRRVPALRRSPAHIVWPGPSSCYSPPVAGRPRRPVATKTSKSCSCMKLPAAWDEAEMLQAQRAEHAPRPGPSLSSQSWWGYLNYGPVRADQLGVGHPRFYHWAPFNQRQVDEVRCMVMRAGNRSFLPHLNPKALGPLLPKETHHLDGQEYNLQSDSDDNMSTKGHNRFLLTRVSTSLVQKKRRRKNRY